VKKTRITKSGGLTKCVTLHLYTNKLHVKIEIRSCNQKKVYSNKHCENPAKLDKGACPNSDNCRINSFACPWKFCSAKWDLGVLHRYYELATVI
jgi:hypothetical protein